MYIKNMKLTVYGYEAIPENFQHSSSQKVLEYNRTPITYKSPLVLEVSNNVSTVTCAQSTKLSLSGDASLTSEEFEVYLYDETYSTFFQFAESIRIGSSVSISVLCILKIESFAFYVQNRKQSLSAMAKVNFVNPDIETGTFISPKASTVFYRNTQHRVPFIRCNFAIDYRWRFRS